MTHKFCPTFFLFSLLFLFFFFFMHFKNIFPFKLDGINTDSMGNFPLSPCAATMKTVHNLTGYSFRGKVFKKAIFKVIEIVFFFIFF